MACLTIEKNGVEGLDDRGKIYPCFVCRNSKKGLLYKEEWSEYGEDFTGGSS